MCDPEVDLEEGTLLGPNDVRIDVIDRYEVVTSDRPDIRFFVSVDRNSGALIFRFR